MSVFTSFGIALIAMLIIIFLKLVPGVFALFYHYASGKYSAKKTADLSIFFILGAETLPALLFIIINFILCGFSYTNLNITSKFFLWLISGLLMGLGFAFLFFYFHRGRNTKLFISRKNAKNLNEKAKNVKTRSDAFLLGLISGVPELFFTLPLYLIVFIEIAKNFISATTCSALLLLFILATITPLFFLYAYFRNGNNLANFERQRIKNKSFFRVFIPTLYFLLALLIIIFRIFL